MLPTKFQNKLELIEDLVVTPILESRGLLCTIPDIKNLKENQITDHLVKYLKFHSNSKYQKLYQTEILTIMRPTEVYEDKESNEPDLKIVLFSPSNIITFEAKRINKGNPPNVYCGKEGFQRFTDEYYEVEEYCGMLGYMQEGDLTKVIDDIKSLIEKIFFIKFKEIYKNCFLSYHTCKDNKLKCHHIILDFT